MFLKKSQLLHFFEKTFFSKGPPYEKRIISRCDIICDTPDVEDVESVTLRMSHPLDVTSREVTLALGALKADSANDLTLH